MPRRTIVVHAGATYIALTSPPRMRVAEHDIIALLSSGDQPKQYRGLLHYIFKLNGKLWVVDAEKAHELDPVQQEIAS